MTYGEVNRDVRAAVAELFGYRRITYYLGASGNGKTRAWGSAEQALASADLIQRYRALVWKYAHRVVQTANPPGATQAVWGLPVRLAARIEENAPTNELLPGARVANLGELACPQPVELVEIWRRAAAAAVVGLDRELPALVGQLQRPHRLVLTKDAAELTVALIRLDDRYRWAPGWRHLGDRRRRLEAGDARSSGWENHGTGLVSTAFATAKWANEKITEKAYVVDQLGWRAPPRLVESASTDATARAVDALHNTAVHLGREFPRALELRGLTGLSRLTSLQAARLAEIGGFPVAKQSFDERARTYTTLNSILRRSIGGHLGRGDHAVAQATIALSHLAGAGTATTEQVDQLRRVFDEIDEAIGTRVRQGIEDHRYFVANGRHLAARAERGVYRSVENYEDITGATCSELLGLARALHRIPDVPDVNHALVEARGRLTALLQSVAEPSRRGTAAKERWFSTRESQSVGQLPMGCDLVASAVHMPRQVDPPIVL